MSMWHFSFSFLLILQTIYNSVFMLVIMGYWVLIDEGEKNNLNNFSIRLQHKMWKKWRGLNIFFCTVYWWQNMYRNCIHWPWWSYLSLLVTWKRKPLLHVYLIVSYRYIYLKHSFPYYGLRHDWMLHVYWIVSYRYKWFTLNIPFLTMGWAMIGCCSSTLYFWTIY